MLDTHVPSAVGAARFDATIDKCNCTRRHRSYSAFARCCWHNVAWILGDGPYGTVSYCLSYSARRGESSTTIMLHSAEAEARSTLEHLTHCGSRCTGDHELVRLVLEGDRD